MEGGLAQKGAQTGACTMRASLPAFATVALVAASLFAASAFNYADLVPRTVIATIVTDDNGYLAVAAQDAQYACYVAYTNGKIDVTWDGGTSCVSGASGTGVNPDSEYYFHDVLKITNKGTKTLNRLWLNMTDTVVTINVNNALGAMVTTDTYAQNKVITTGLAPGESWYVGFKIDSTGLNTANSPISKTLSIEARVQG
jgi:hypothetical protein